MLCLLWSDWTLPNKVEILVDILISFHVSGLKWEILYLPYVNQIIDNESGIWTTIVGAVTGIWIPALSW